MGDEELYLKATNEVEGDSKDPALWAKAMALADGDQDKAKYQYIKLRVEQLAKSKPDVQKEYGVHEAKAEAVEQVADIDNTSGISGSEVSKEDARKHDPSASETPKDAVGADAADDLQTLRKKAEAGDATAQYRLGVIYFDGHGVPQDDIEALKWYGKAAEAGDAAAQYNLGVMYANGRGVVKDDAVAMKWYRKAAERGHDGAQYYLGLISEEGWHDKESSSKNSDNSLGAVAADNLQTLRKQAEEGDADAQYKLGDLYHTGTGVPQDSVVAVKWYHKAAAQGYADAQYNLGWIYAQGRGVPKDDAEAVKWYRKAAAQGHDGAQHDLALRGDGARQDKGSSSESSDNTSADRGLTLERFIVAVGLWLCCAFIAIYPFFQRFFDMELFGPKIGYLLGETFGCAVIAVPFALFWKWILNNPPVPLVEICSIFTIIICGALKLILSPKYPETLDFFSCREVVLGALPLAIGTFLMAAVSLRKRPVTWFLFAFFIPVISSLALIVVLLKEVRQSERKK